MYEAIFGSRPIINSIDQPKSELCQLVDLILKPIVAHIETMLREQLRFKKDNIYLYSCDFESLYTNIRKKDAVNIITDYVNESSLSIT